MVSVSLAQIKQLAPSARSSYRTAFENCGELLTTLEILTSPLRIAHFMAQILHETAALTIQFEDLNYSAERLPKVWPSRFLPRGPLSPADYAHDPRKLGNSVYGGRMGNTAPDDGYNYRGRGLLQTTGRESYERAFRAVQSLFPDCPNFVSDPDSVLDAQWCIPVAATEWTRSGCNGLADQDNVRKVTRAINGGLIGISNRMEWLKKTKAIWKS